MRLLIAAPRKSGNARLRCLLATAYGLELVGSRDVPDGAGIGEVASWLSDLPDSSVAHVPWGHTAALDMLAAKHEARFVAILRHPFDLLLSVHEIAQHRSGKKGRQGQTADSWAVLAHRELSDPEVLAYLHEGFSDEIAWLRDWHDSGAPLLRFELLDADPAGALAALASDLGSLADETIAHAVAVCPAENLVRSSPVRGRRMPAVSAGAWRERLSDEHLAILRDRYGSEVSQLGYELF